MELIRRISIRQKLIILLMASGLMPTLVVSSVAYVTISRQLTGETVDQLQSLAVKQAQRIDASLQADQQDILLLAGQRDFRSAIGAYTVSPSKNVGSLETILSNKAAAEAPNIQSIVLINPNNVIFASTVPGQDGQKLNVPDITEASRGNAINVAYDPVNKADKVYFSTPVTVDGQNVGALILIYKTDAFVATVQDYTGLDSTGDTIVAYKNTQNKVISLFPLRFDRNAALNTDVTSMNLYAHLNSTYRGVENYRHHQVMVAAEPVTATNWVVATEIDTAEAFQPIAELRNVLTLIVAISPLVIAVFALYLTRYFTAPILAITNKTRAIMKGDYSQRIEVKSRDELGTLAQAYNEMSASLQLSTRKLGEEHARLQASLNSLNIGFLMTTNDGRIFMCNPAMLQILDLNPPSAGHNQVLLSLEDVQKHLPNFDLRSAIESCLNTGKAFNANEINLGSKFLSIIGAPIRLETKEVIGSVLVVEDTTEAKILARSKDEFFSIASHELRTPLTAIKGNTSMIMDFYAELLKDPAVKEMLTDIHDSSVRLIDIVNDFLDVSRLEQGKIVFKNDTVYMEKVIESVVYEMRPVLKDKKLYLNFDRLTLESLPPVWADPDRVKQVVYNLVGNAAKFTETGGISITSEKREHDIKICVTDTGRGIPEDKQQLLFHKFQQAGSSLLTRDTTRGTGLGLYISKMLIERMGGKIELESSQVDKGTTFHFTLPLATEEQIKSVSKKDGPAIESPE